MKRVTVVLTASASAERNATACKLAERILARGHRVAVFAHGDATALSAGTGEVAAAVAALVRRGVRGGGLDWVVDADAAARLGVGDAQVPGVLPGDHADLWAFVREADVVLGAGRS